MLYLSPEELTSFQMNFFTTNSIQLVHLGGKQDWQSTPGKPISEDMVKEALELILDVQKHPLMVMCKYVLIERQLLQCQPSI